MKSGTRITAAARKIAICSEHRGNGPVGWMDSRDRISARVGRNPAIAYWALRGLEERGAALRVTAGPGRPEPRALLPAPAHAGGRRGRAAPAHRLMTSKVMLVGAAVRARRPRSIWPRRGSGGSISACLTEAVRRTFYRWAPPPRLLVGQCRELLRDARRRARRSAHHRRARQRQPRALDRSIAHLRPRPQLTPPRPLTILHHDQARGPSGEIRP